VSTILIILNWPNWPISCSLNVYAYVSSGGLGGWVPWAPLGYDTGYRPYTLLRALRTLRALRLMEAPLYSVCYFKWVHKLEPGNPATGLWLSCSKTRYDNKLTVVGLTMFGRNFKCKVAACSHHPCALNCYRLIIYPSDVTHCSVRYTRSSVTIACTGRQSLWEIAFFWRPEVGRWFSDL